MEGVLSELPMHEVTFIRRITAYSDAGGSDEMNVKRGQTYTRVFKYL